MKIFAAVVVVVLAFVVQAASGEQCGKQAGDALCLNDQHCCSEYGYCGTGTLYCGNGCQSGPCFASPPPPPSPPPPAEGGLGSILNQSVFNSFFPSPNNFYNYQSLIDAAEVFPLFGAQGTLEQRKREVAAFSAHVCHETTCLVYIEEINQADPYCQPSTQYPCAEGQKYFGRGPLQLSWNYNYGPAGNDLGYPLLANPGLVAKDPVLAFKTAIWFWMRPIDNKPSCHDVMVDAWNPTPDDTAAGRKPGFGQTINIINGGKECGKGTPTAEATRRIEYYKKFCELLGVAPGDNLDCSTARPYYLMNQQFKYIYQL